MAQRGCAHDLAYAGHPSLGCLPSAEIRARALGRSRHDALSDRGHVPFAGRAVPGERAPLHSRPGSVGASGRQICALMVARSLQLRGTPIDQPEGESRRPPVVRGCRVVLLLYAPLAAGCRRLSFSLAETSTTSRIAWARMVRGPRLASRRAAAAGAAARSGLRAGFRCGRVRSRTTAPGAAAPHR